MPVYVDDAGRTWTAATDQSVRDAAAVNYNLRAVRVWHVKLPRAKRRRGVQPGERVELPVPNTALTLTLHAAAGLPDVPAVTHVHILSRVMLTRPHRWAATAWFVTT